MPVTAVMTTEAPTPATFLSQAVRRGQLIQVSGQGGTTTLDQSTRLTTVGEQTEQALASIEAILRAADNTFDDVLMFRVYITSRTAFEDMNVAYEHAVHRRITTDVMPARTTLITGLPQPDMLVEIDALAIGTDSI